MKIKKIFVLLIPILTCSCSAIESSLEYTRGTQCLESGDYSAAVVHLENAVKLDPKLSRNHCNLAVAYRGIHDIKKGWYHARQAVLLDMNNHDAIYNFKQMSQEIFKLYDIKEGMSIDEVILLLGKPDHINDTTKGTVYFYATIGIEFIDGKLESALDTLQ